MENNTPENIATDTTTPPADQTGTPEPSTPLADLESIAARHLDSHPGFDPAIHAANEDGTPKRKADGSYAMKRGRKAGSGPRDPLPGKNGNPAPVSAPQIVQAPEAPRIAPDEAARQSANLVINASVWICGEEIGKPIDRAEAEGLKLSFVNYYEARGVPNIPPEIGLVLALGSYVAPRLRKAESEHGKLTKFYLWFKAKTGL